MTVAAVGCAERGRDEWRDGSIAQQDGERFSLSACPSPAGAGEGGRRPGEGCEEVTIFCGEGRGEGER
jgi:hypothetical protein